MVTRYIAVALGLTFGATACGSDSASTDTQHRPSRTYTEDELVADAVGRQLHLVEGQASIDVGIALEIAREHDRAICMQAAGFDYVESPIQSLISIGPAIDIFDEEVASVSGFGLSFVPDPSSIVAKPNDRTLAALSIAEQDAWQKQSEACEDVMRESDRERRITSALQIVFDLYARLDSDPVVLSARSDFHACMSDSGFPEAGSSLADVYDVLYQRLADEGGTPTPEFSSYERALAVANARCFRPLFDVETARLAALVEDADAELYNMLFG